MEDGRWIRIHPVPFRLEEYRRFRKYQWIMLDLKKHRTDRRPESYSPAGDHTVLEYVDTVNEWKERKKLILRQVYHSYRELTDEVIGEKGKSLAVLKPSRIINFEFEETDREWPEKWKRTMLQRDFFHPIAETDIIEKIPYNFYYVFMTEDDTSTHRIMITDWEVGALYWNCLERSEGDEETALRKVKERFLHEFTSKRDIYFFMGSHYEHHMRGFHNPLMIVGVFYPPKATQLEFDFDS